MQALGNGSQTRFTIEVTINCFSVLFILPTYMYNTPDGPFKSSPQQEVVSCRVNPCAGP